MRFTGLSEDLLPGNPAVRIRRAGWQKVNFAEKNARTRRIGEMGVSAATKGPGRAVYEVLIGRPGDSGMTPALVTRMFRLRYEVFYRQLGWDVDGDGGLERDEFDDLDPVYAVAVNRDGNAVAGCLRLLPTTGPHMLRDVAAFRPALQGRPSPHSPRIWEMSRFAVAPQAVTASANTGAPHSATAGFSPVPRALLGAAGSYAQARGIEKFAILSSVAVERMANSSGIPTSRIGDRAARIGTLLCATYCVPASALAALAGPVLGMRAAPNQ